MAFSAKFGNNLKEQRDPEEEQSRKANRSQRKNSESNKREKVLKDQCLIQRKERWVKSSTKTRVSVWLIRIPVMEKWEVEVAMVVFVLSFYGYALWSWSLVMFMLLTSTTILLLTWWPCYYSFTLPLSLSLSSNQSQRNRHYFWGVLLRGGKRVVRVFFHFFLGEIKRESVFCIFNNYYLSCPPFHFQTTREGDFRFTFFLSHPPNYGINSH